MDTQQYSPHILIYLQVGDQTIRLADVLAEDGRLYSSDFTEVPQGTVASLVISIDGREERKEVILKKGLSKNDKFVRFCDPRSEPVMESEEPCLFDW